MRTYKRVHWSEGWKSAAELEPVRGWLPEIGYSSTESSGYRWCAHFGGNGHYFRSAREAVAYAYGRGWIASHSAAEELSDRLEAGHGI